MARAAVALVLAAALVATAHADNLFCDAIFDNRATLLTSLGRASQLSPNQFAVLWADIASLNSDLQLLQCCSGSNANYFARNYASGFGTGAVCGFDFNTYQTAAAACPAGVYHAGACFSRNTNTPCANPSLPLAVQINCTLNVVNNIVNGIQLYSQPYDAFLAAQVIPCTTQTGFGYDRTHFRQEDGSCNNIGVPPPGLPVNFAYSGMAGNLFTHENRNLPQNPTAYLNSGPNPRLISNALYTQSTPITNPVGGNGLVMAHVNFFVHDFYDHTNNDWAHPIAVPIGSNDPFWGASTSFGSQVNWDEDEVVMLIPGTSPSADDTSTPTSGFPMRRNQQTAWFDASQVYGASKAVTDSLRSFQNGMLTMGAGNLLPDNLAGVRFAKRPFLAGDYRANFHPGLTAFHTLWAREHNTIAHFLGQYYSAAAAQNYQGALAAVQAAQAAHQQPPAQLLEFIGLFQAFNPSGQVLTEEGLFQTARLIVSAEIIKIHTLEWSEQQANSAAEKAVLLNLASNLGQPMNPALKAGTHTVPEEFVAAYKWHAFVPPTLTLVNNSGVAVASNVDYVAQFQDTTLIRTHGIEPVLIGLGRSLAGSNRLNNLPPGLQNIQHPFLYSAVVNPFAQPSCVVVPGIDFGTVDIVRDRERGINKYNDFRTLVSVGQLPTALYFDDLADTPAQAATLASLYQWNINNVDAIVGMYGEHLYSNINGNGFPITMDVAFLPFVIDRLVMDRFYTDDFNAATYTNWGMNRLQSVDFAQVLCDNGVTCNVPDRTRTFFQWTGPMTTQTVTPTAF